MSETIETLKQKQSAFAQEIIGALNRVKEDVDFLKSKIPADGSIVVTQSDLDSLGVGLDAAIASVKAVDPLPANPTPPPPPPTDPT